ncbi:MAG TPA: hypothetical protein VNB54_05210 [Alphaproteobacteria bacterium]|nr:hypothetical protein [Alphaproteobacteria bacterium]
MATDDADRVFLISSISVNQWSGLFKKKGRMRGAAPIVEELRRCTERTSGGGFYSRGFIPKEFRDLTKTVALSDAKINFQKNVPETLKKHTSK